MGNVLSARTYGGCLALTLAKDTVFYLGGQRSSNAFASIDPKTWELTNLTGPPVFPKFPQCITYDDGENEVMVVVSNGLTQLYFVHVS